MDVAQVDLIERLTRLAFEFGPFLFAVLCLLWVTRVAYKYYNSACVAQPPVPPKEISTHRLVYYGAWVFSALMVVASVTWWMANYRTTKVYKFSILDLTEDEFIVSPSTSIFLQSRTQSLPGGDGLRRLDVILVVVSEESIEQLAPFRIKYLNRKRGRWTEFRIPYSDKTYYKIVDGKLELASTAQMAATTIAARKQKDRLLWQAQFSGGMTSPSGQPSGLGSMKTGPLGGSGGLFDRDSPEIGASSSGLQWEDPKYGKNLGVTTDPNHAVQKNLKLNHSEMYQIMQQNTIRLQ